MSEPFVLDQPLASLPFSLSLSLSFLSLLHYTSFDGDMTAQHPPPTLDTVTLPIAPSLPVVAPKISDPFSSSANEPSASPSAPTLPSLETDHLWASLEGTFARWADEREGPSCGAFLSVGFAMSAGLFMAGASWMIGADDSWTWLEGADLSSVARFLAKWAATLCVEWPVRVGAYALGLAWTGARHGLMIYAVTLPLALLYSTYSNQTVPVSFLFPFLPARIARIVDFFVPVALSHFLITCDFPANLPCLLYVHRFFAVSYANAFLLVLGTSFPHLFYRLFVLVRNTNLDKPGPLFPSLLVGGEASEMKKKEVEEFKKENAALKAMLDAAK